MELTAEKSPGRSRSVYRIYVGEGGDLLQVRVRHALLGEEPCVVFEDALFPSGKSLTNSIELVASSYRLELLVKRKLPAQRELAIVQARMEMKPRATAGRIFERVFMRLEGTRYRQARWEPLGGALRFSASSPTSDWVTAPQHP